MTLLLALLLSAPVVLAQTPPSPAPEGGPAAGELREAIKQFFERRMREELALTDEQMTAMRPLVEEIERSRASTRRERARTVRALREGLRGGASDRELQDRLDRLDRIEDEQRAHERLVMARIDEQLTVRQRVQFRFFIEAFRRRMEDRIRELRSERDGRMRREPLDRRTPPPDRP
jgi:Spy/CpxP family protein refolding chaperone